MNNVNNSYLACYRHTASKQLIQWFNKIFIKWNNPCLGNKAHNNLHSEIIQKSTEASKTNIPKKQMHLDFQLWTIHAMMDRRNESPVIHWCNYQNPETVRGSNARKLNSKRKFQWIKTRIINYPDTLHKRNSTGLLLKDCRTCWPIWRNEPLEKFFNLKD